MKQLIIAATMFAAFGSAFGAEASESSPKELVDLIVRAATDETVMREKSKGIKESIESNPAEASAAIVEKLKDASLDEKAKCLCLVALGVAGQTNSVPLVKGFYDLSCPTSKVSSCARQSMALIGGDEAGAFLLEEYRRNKESYSNVTSRFDAFLPLARMQYAPALPEAAEFLEIDHSKYAWIDWVFQFIFGYYDDVAVPLLCEKSNDEDEHVRRNAHTALKFLMPYSPDVSKAVLKRLGKATDEKERHSLVELLEWSMQESGGNVKLKEEFAKLLKTEKPDSCTAKFMRETLFEDSLAREAAMRSRFKPDAEKFEKRYRKLCDNGVHLSGKDVEVLMKRATKKDLPALKALRRRALDRQSDECFYDHTKLTRIIHMVRMFAPDEPPAPASDEAAK